MVAFKITQAEGGFVMSVKGKPAGDEVFVYPDGAALFVGLVAKVPGMADAAWDWSVDERIRRLELATAEGKTPG